MSPRIQEKGAEACTALVSIIVCKFEPGQLCFPLARLSRSAERAQHLQQRTIGALGLAIRLRVISS